MHRAMRFAEHHRLLTQRQHAPRTQTHVRKNRVKIPRHIPRLHAVERTEVRTGARSFPRGCRIAQATPAIPPRNRNAGSAARPRRRKLHRAPWRAVEGSCNRRSTTRQRFFSVALRDRRSPGAPIAPRVRAARFRFRFRFSRASPPPGSRSASAMRCGSMYVSAEILELLRFDRASMNECGNPIRPARLIMCVRFGRATRLAR